MKGIRTERHPLSPFIPEGAEILMLGSFPPKREKWSMEFFYPNFINDMWRIMGLVFFSDKEHFIGKEPGCRRFDKEKVVEFCREKHIALYDAAYEVRRLKDNASDRFLEVAQPTDIKALLDEIPECKAIVSTGQKATEVIIGTFGCREPEVGGWTDTGYKGIRLWRMPSSSRAYPLKIEKKAEHYKAMFTSVLQTDETQHKDFTV